MNESEFVVHVVPDWQDHTLSQTCWCSPTREPDVSGYLWSHRCSSDDPPHYAPGTDPALRAPGRHWLVVSEAKELSKMAERVKR